MPLPPSVLPDIEVLRRRTQALAMLDAIVCPEWEYRYFSFNAAWNEGEQMASMRNGEGDDWFLLFGPAGAALKGLAHESPVASGPAFATGIQKAIPVAFSSFLQEAAFSMDRASFCYWRGLHDAAWSKVSHPDPAMTGADDGSDDLLALLVAPAPAYLEFARGYYECELPLVAIEALYGHAPLTRQLVTQINPALTFEEAEASAIEAGYPCAPGSACHP
jgi:hypothetical protein